METVRRRVVVGGRVQGVWFRESTRREALGRGVNGWVRNLANGDVEAVFEGNPIAVVDMVEWARTGPERATVTSLEEFAEEPQGLVAFEVLHSA